MERGTQYANRDDKAEPTAAGEREDQSGRPKKHRGRHSPAVASAYGNEQQRRYRQDHGSEISGRVIRRAHGATDASEASVGLDIDSRLYAGSAFSGRRVS